MTAKNRLNDPPIWLNVATTLEKSPTPTHTTNPRNDLKNVVQVIVLGWLRVHKIVFLVSDTCISPAGWYKLPYCQRNDPNENIMTEHICVFTINYSWQKVHISEISFELVVTQYCHSHLIKCSKPYGSEIPQCKGTIGITPDWRISDRDKNEAPIYE